MSENQMKGITCCGDCGSYDWKKHRCSRPCKDEGDAQSNFYADCPLPDVAPVEVIRKVLKDWLSDERYCTREWSAWSYGTMTQDDFVPIDVDEIVDDIVKTANMDGGEKHAID